MRRFPAMARPEGRMGFTLIELMVVIAIMGVLAAIAVPAVTSQLRKSQEQSYKSEVDAIQELVDNYFSDPDNEKFLGKRTYPLLGRAQTDQQTLTNQTTQLTGLDDNRLLVDTQTLYKDDVAQSKRLWNPVGATVGVADLNTKWTDDDTDGLRDIGSTGDSDRWTTVVVVRSNKSYHTDPRYFFIDFDEMVTKKFLKVTKIPKSAAHDNCPTSTTACKGHYIWYVDNEGDVQSLYVEYPSTKGFVDGVFP